MKLVARYEEFGVQIYDFFRSKTVLELLFLVYLQLNRYIKV